MSRSDWQYAEVDYEEPEELVGEELAEAIKAKNEFDAAYALWKDSGEMCGCGRPITFDDFYNQPCMCPACLDEYHKQMRALMNTEEWWDDQ